MTFVQWLGLFVLSLIWGSSFLFVELAVDHIRPFTIVFFRVALAALALIGYCRIRGHRIPLTADRIGQYLVMGLIAHALPFTALTWGQTQITAGLASIYNATTPLFTVLAAHMLLADERASAMKFAGVLTGFAGVAVLIGGGLGAATAGNLLGQLGALSAAVLYALCAVYGRRFSGIPPAGIAAASLTSAALIMAPLAAWQSGMSFSLPPLQGAAAILILALLCTGVAYIIYYKMLARVGATNLMLVTFLIPATAIMLGIVFLGETLEPHHLAGLGLIFCGLILVDGQMVRRFLGRGVRRDAA